MHRFPRLPSVGHAPPPPRRIPREDPSRRGRLLALGTLLWSCTFLPVPAQGQVLDASHADPFSVPGFVVTPTRTPMSTHRTPTPITVLTGDELRSRGLRSVAEALRIVPGMSVVQAGAAGAQTSLFLRGGQSNYVRVLIDGVPVNDAGGAIDLADFSTDQVERIEIVRGPGSVLYGSEAVSGVIQVFTTRGRGDGSFEASVVGGIGERRHGSGRYGLSDVDATLSGARNGWSWSTGGARSSTAGLYPVNNARTLGSLSGRLQWIAPVGGTDLSLTTRFSESETGVPTDGAGFLVDENSTLGRQSWATSLEAGRNLGSRLDVRMNLGYLRRDQLSRDEPDSPTDTVGTVQSELESGLSRRSADLRLNGRVARSTVTLGATLESVQGSTRYASDGEWGPLEADATYSRANSAGYVQVLTEPLPGLDATLGGRVDHNEAFGSFDTFRVGLSWAGWKGGRLRGAAGRAFREPTFAENYGSGFGDAGNPDLVPERTWSRELGMEHQVGPIHAAVTWFDQTFRDMIQYSASGAEEGSPNYLNVGAAVARGWEWSWQSAVGPMRLAGSYTRMRTRVLDPGLATDATFVQGEELVRRPPHMGNVSMVMPVSEGSVGATVNVVGKRADMDFSRWPAPRVTLARHTTIDLSLERGLSRLPLTGARILIRVENVLDAEYEAITGFPAPGRIVRLGLRVAPGL